jgi:hypothetical protein
VLARTPAAYLDQRPGETPSSTSPGAQRPGDGSDVAVVARRTPSCLSNRYIAAKHRYQPRDGMGVFRRCVAAPGEATHTHARAHTNTKRAKQKNWCRVATQNGHGATKRAWSRVPSVLDSARTACANRAAGSVTTRTVNLSSASWLIRDRIRNKNRRGAACRFRRSKVRWSVRGVVTTASTVAVSCFLFRPKFPSLFAR